MKDIFDTIAYAGGLIVGLAFIGLVGLGIAASITIARMAKKEKEQSAYDDYS